MEIRVIDVSARSLRLFGDRETSSAVAGCEVPKHDWRFELTTDTGAVVTFGRQMTASDVMYYITVNGEHDLTHGLCDNVERHEPHVTLVGEQTPYWCDADQSRRPLTSTDDQATHLEQSTETT